MKKRYSAFVSSVYRSLIDEREEVIKCLLNMQWIPICMEYFTVSSSENFSALQDLIDDSDIVILLLGREYGSVDEDGISWTEKEFDYAKKHGKPICALACPEFVELERQDPETVTPEEQKQLDFSKKVGYARRFSENGQIREFLMQFIGGENRDGYIGWARNRGTERMQAAWRQENRAFDLGGRWYHVHLSEEDETYIRVGELQISQIFDMEHYRDLTFTASNYSAVRYDAQTDRLIENKMKYTTWGGDNYELEENGEILGIYHAKRHFTDKFGTVTMGKGEHRGIHDFQIDVTDRTEETNFFCGAFHDEAPSPKHGLIYVFRTEGARLAFLKENFPFLLENITK